jgi:transcriptional regulator GlxA family with amidase domain
MKHPIKTPSPNGVRRPSPANTEADPRLKWAMRFFDQRFAERVTIQSAAWVAGLSPDHFGEVFHAALGCTPHQYLVRCRLRHARQLIVSEGHQRSLAEIAWAAGFADQAHLTRHFQRAFRQSPGQWRQQILCKTGFNFPGFVQDAWLTVRPD